jgi:hypothetical protein
MTFHQLRYIKLNFRLEQLNEYKDSKFIKCHMKDS